MLLSWDLLLAPVVFFCRKCSPAHPAMCSFPMDTSRAWALSEDSWAALAGAIKVP